MSGLFKGRLLIQTLDRIAKIQLAMEKMPEKIKEMKAVRCNCFFHRLSVFILY